MKRHLSPKPERGAVAVEFAVVVTVFLMLLIGIIEWGRVLYQWNTTAEATRLGARMAVVCDLNDTDIRTQMRTLFPVLADADISLTYAPDGCTVTNCKSVTLAINPNKSIDTFIPFKALALTLPPFTTTLTRESMQSNFNGAANPVCQ